MISVEEALERILALVPVLPPEDVPILDALGQVTATDVVARLNIPPLDNTAMDGYAVRASDTDGASATEPVRLTVVGELAAGYVFPDELAAGGAVRIMTGAPVPPGADAIVPFEETDEPEGRAFGSFAKDRDFVNILKGADVGANIRYAAEDVREGDVIIPKGTVVHPAQIGVLASLGVSHVTVHRRPVVAILSTGDEVVRPGKPLKPGQIYDSNTYSLSAMVQEAGGVPLQLGISADTVEALTSRIREGFQADMLVTSAGVSRGDYDVVKDVLAKEGTVDFWTVRMRPGKPLAFGSFDAGGRRIPHIGLPGNPVSSMVSFELFGRPAVFKMLGRSDWQRPRIQAVALEDIPNTDGRRVFARAIVEERDGRWTAALTGPQGSGILTSMASANAFAIVPEDVPLIAAGSPVDCMMLE